MRCLTMALLLALLPACRQIVKQIDLWGIDMVFVVGGNGGNAGAAAIQEELEKHNILCRCALNLPATQCSLSLQCRSSPAAAAAAMPPVLTWLLAHFGCHIGPTCSVVGVPKSIDNDILLIDKTFG